MRETMTPTIEKARSTDVSKRFGFYYDEAMTPDDTNCWDITSTILTCS